MLPAFDPAPGARRPSRQETSGGAFAFELRFASAAEAEAAEAQLCAATVSAHADGALLASNRALCAALLGLPASAAPQSGR
jgi:hypothetical protein